jgi:hypothetical protein
VSSVTTRQGPMPLTQTPCRLPASFLENNSCESTAISFHQTASASNSAQPGCGSCTSWVTKARSTMAPPASASTALLLPVPMSIPRNIVVSTCRAKIPVHAIRLSCSPMAEAPAKPPAAVGKGGWSNRRDSGNDDGGSTFESILRESCAIEDDDTAGPGVEQRQGAGTACNPDKGATRGGLFEWHSNLP